MLRNAPPTLMDDPLRAACPATCPRLPDEASIGLRHRFVDANGVRFHIVEAGFETDSRPLVLLLHGFPEFWYGWRAQIPALAAHFRVVAPDLRGYNLTAKPADGYDYATLASDVPALIRALGAERAHVVGHDWGGMVAWTAATLHPERVDRLVILNAPHPAAYLRVLEEHPTQWLRSWYIGLFQARGLAEWLLARDYARGVADMLRRSSLRAATFSTADLAAYRRAILRPGALSAALAYYRALPTTSPEEIRTRFGTVAAPTLLIWGMQDAALSSTLTEGLDAWVPNLRVERIAEASHWVQHEQAATVNRLLLAHLSGEPDALGTVVSTADEAAIPPATY
jgi:pimeloyl-ACP methyl ester carboxylesterase